MGRAKTLTCQQYTDANQTRRWKRPKKIPGKRWWGVEIVRGDVAAPDGAVVAEIGAEATAVIGEPDGGGLVLGAGEEQHAPSSISAASLSSPHYYFLFLLLPRTLSFLPPSLPLPRSDPREDGELASTFQPEEKKKEKTRNLRPWVLFSRCMSLWWSSLQYLPLDLWDYGL